MSSDVLDECESSRKFYGSTDCRNPFCKRCSTDTDKIQQILETVQRIESTIVKADELITTIAAKVEPVMDQLMKSPIMKMLGVK